MASAPGCLDHDRYGIGRDGATPYERHEGRPLHGDCADCLSIGFEAHAQGRTVAGGAGSATGCTAMALATTTIQRAIWPSGGGETSLGTTSGRMVELLGVRLVQSTQHLKRVAREPRSMRTTSTRRLHCLLYVLWSYFRLRVEWHVRCLFGRKRNKYRSVTVVLRDGLKFNVRAENFRKVRPGRC